MRLYLKLDQHPMWITTLIREASDLHVRNGENFRAAGCGRSLSDAASIQILGLLSPLVESFQFKKCPSGTSQIRGRRLRRSPLERSVRHLLRCLGRKIFGLGGFGNF